MGLISLGIFLIVLIAILKFVGIVIGAGVDLIGLGVLIIVVGVVIEVFFALTGHVRRNRWW